MAVTPMKLILIATNVGGLAMPDIETMKHKMIHSMAGSDQTYVGGFLRTVGFEVKGAAVELIF